jgi:thiopeptide-type bacteriocin biosynthesis protein
MIENTQRTFIPGSEWIYYKVYCGVNTADRILTQRIEPLAKHLIAQNTIDKWFFIRYADPDAHLRIRFHVSDQKKMDQVIRGVAEVLNSYIENKLIWDVQLATYHRELERYGTQTICQLESFFYHDSQAIINLIKNAIEEQLRFQQVFHHVNRLIDLFIANAEEKLSFLEDMQNSYKVEFNATHSASKKLMGKKFRSFKNSLQQASDSLDYTAFEILANQLLDFHVKETLEMPLHNLLRSIVHMSVNRAFQSRQRLYEMVLYDFLFQKTRSDFYRQQKG